MSLEHHLLEELCSYLLEKQKEYQGKRMLIGLCGAPGCLFCFFSFFLLVFIQILLFLDQGKQPSLLGLLEN